LEESWAWCHGGGSEVVAARTRRQLGFLSDGAGKEDCGGVLG
jgi:hypothetical protein